MEMIEIYALRGVALVVILVAVLAVIPRLGHARDVAVGSTLCRNDGYIDWTRDDGTPFTSQGHCVRYVTEGGTLVPAPGLPPRPADRAPAVPHRYDRHLHEPST